MPYAKHDFEFSRSINFGADRQHNYSYVATSYYIIEIIRLTVTLS